MYLFIGLCISSYADTLISPADKRINYFGRFDMTDPAKPVFNWSGAIIEARFPGPTIGMSISHANAYYDIEIDGVIDTVISCSSNQQYIFSKTLSQSMHTLRIILRSEDHYSKATFQGIYLANGKTLGEAPAKPDRKIEFIGDSYTAGYGIESPGRSCDEFALKKYTNANKAFPLLITKSFHAQSIVLGWSGKGVVRNYGDSKKRSDMPYSYYYDRLLGEADQMKWDFIKWIPDLVVICLGTNDFSTNPHPDDSMYIGDYHKLIKRIVTNYPSAKIACVATTDETIKRLVKQVVTEENGVFNHSQVFAADFPATVENMACDWHPSLTDNRNIAKGIVDVIMKKLSWDTAAPTVALPAPALPKPHLSQLSITSTNSALFVKMTDCASQNTIYLLTINGRKITQQITDKAGSCMFSTASLPLGMYLIGNNDLGWNKTAVKMKTYSKN